MIVIIDFAFLRYKKIICFSNKKEIDVFNNFKPISFKLTVIVGIVFSIINFFILLSVCKNTEIFINIVKLIVILAILEIVSITDFKLKIIPNSIILIGLIVRVVLYIIEFFTKIDDFISILKSDLIGFAFGFGLLLLACIISRQSIGFGDVKLFAVIGITTGFTCTFSTLFISLIVSAIVGLIMLISKKMTKKDSMPFAPCVLIGYLTTLFLVIY